MATQKREAAKRRVHGSGGGGGGGSGSGGASGGVSGIRSAVGFEFCGGGSGWRRVAPCAAGRQVQS
jgi:hypothetical protein